MSLRFVDLSVSIAPPVEGELAGDLAPLLAAGIEYQTHKDTVPAALRVFGCKEEDLPEGLAWASEQMNLSTHAGTHMDSTYHYWPTSQGVKSRTIDEIPLEECFGDGVVLDLRHKKAGERTMAAEIKAALEKTGHTLKPGDIVCLRFGHDRHFGTATYWDDYAGMSAEATIWLIDRGVKTIGTDAVGFDRGFPYQKADFARTGDRSLLWEAHRVGVDREYWQIEKMANLDKLPPTGFKIACFPVKIKGASAGWVRPVAIFGL
jgi:kynurenine formamidase